MQSPQSLWLSAEKIAGRQLVAKMMMPDGPAGFLNAGSGQERRAPKAFGRRGTT